MHTHVLPYCCHVETYANNRVIERLTVSSYAYRLPQRSWLRITPPEGIWVLFIQMFSLDLWNTFRDMPASPCTFTNAFTTARDYPRKPIELSANSARLLGGS